MLILTVSSLSAQNAEELNEVSAPVAAEQYTQGELLSADLMAGEEQIIFIQDRWLFMPGDSLEWADSDYDDSHWDIVSTNLTRADLSFIDWSGTGWFRKEFRVSPELREKPLALLIDRHLGASEVYLNGEKIHELGTYSTNPEQVKAFRREAPLPIVFPNQERNILAVRFMNPQVEKTGEWMHYNGFRFLFADWSTHQDQKYAYLSEWTGRNMFFIGILLAFAVIHFLLFAFYPIERRNLYFSLFVSTLAILAYLFYRFELSDYTFDALFFIRFIFVMELLVLAFAARFTHSIDKKHAPFYSNALVTGIVVAAIVVGIYPDRLIWVREVAVIILILEIFRAVGVMFYHRVKGVWVVGAGVLLFVLGLLYSILVNFELMDGTAQNGTMAGAAFLVLSMSVYLSRDFANTQKNLENKLQEVKILNQKTLEQEQINKEREIEKRLLEAENKRKTKELEEARALQLSMLPKSMPSYAGYNLSVYMKTATEVGGDYYDYSLENGKLTLTIGDATGHGLKAGIMVAAAKSYFHTLVHDCEGANMMHRMSAGLKNMNMRMMYMGLTLVECAQNSVNITTAGMPPALHYQKSSKIVQDILLKGLPLGSRVKYPYQSKQLMMDRGDVLFLMSDGLCELFNKERQMIGLEKLKHELQKSAEFSSSEIIQHFKDLIAEWNEGTNPHDDITMMVLKKNSEE